MWQQELKNSITTINELKQYVRLTRGEERHFKKIIKRHPMQITRHYLKLIDFEDPDDPIKKIVVPTEEEMILVGSYDTSGERTNTKFFGFQHKYDQTALVLSTNRCASYCRFCFRKRMIGKNTKEVIKNFEKAVEYIQEHKEINNILITGGDPLVLPTSIIEEFLRELKEIDHLDFIRFGTKVPVFLPNRIIQDKKLINLLASFTRKHKQIYFVLQVDHIREITKELQQAVQMLKRAGIILNNQTVLLHGVNEDPDVLAALQNKLVAVGINPYYVFQCRPVKRVKKQYQISLFKGLNIVREAKKKLNGHSKRFKYVMSHKTGKIEILGIRDDYIYFKYHQAKDPKNHNRFFRKKLIKTAGWLDDL